MEFGGFIGGLGKLFFKNGRDIERERGFLERWKGEVIFFLNFFEGVEENSKFCGGMYFWDYGGIFGLCMGRDVIWNIP